MTNSKTLGTIEATNPVLAVAPLKEETEMLRATDKITALYCRLSVEDMKEDKKGRQGGCVELYPESKNDPAPVR